MVRFKTAVLLFGAGILVSGCSLFFGFNAFASVDKPPAPTVAEYQGADGLAHLAADLDSPAVVAVLKADPATVAQVKDYLHATYLSGDLTTPDQQTAAVLYADLSLKTTSGDVLVNNVVTTIMSTPTTGTVDSIISSIIPASVLADATGAAFKAMVQGLLDANAAYTQLGNSQPPWPDGVNAGDVAQKATVACMMQAAVDAVTAAMTPTTLPAVEAELFKLVTRDPSCTITSVPMTDPLSQIPSFLQNIFNAAGLTGFPA